MKKILFATTLASLIGLCARAQDITTQGTNVMQVPNEMPSVSITDYVQKIGVGVTFGEPIGVSVKYWLSDIVAVDAAGGWSVADHSSAEIHADILLHSFDLIPVSQGKLPVYVGVGALGRFRNNGFADEAGVRIPVGISYMFDNCPVDIFAEMGPAILFTPEVKGGIDGGIGVRYWF
jgi:hypothetical protein